MLLYRIISAAVLIPLIVLLAYLGGLGWCLGVSVAGVLAWRELARMLQQDRFRASLVVGLLVMLSLVFEAYAQSAAGLTIDLLRSVLAGTLVISLVWALYIHSEHPTADWGVTYATALYLGVGLSHFVILRERPGGLAWVVLAFALTWIADSMAYFVGNWLGKHKLWPRISPRKTWEGLAGGSVAVSIAGLLLAPWWVGINPGWGLVLGLLVAVAAPFGDFVMSLFKRMAHAKDSSNLIPGHGGMLDRLDSLLFVFPLVTYFARIIAGP